jgi:hypothetical protein
MTLLTAETYQVPELLQEQADQDVQHSPADFFFILSSSLITSNESRINTLGDSCTLPCTGAISIAVRPIGAWTGGKFLLSNNHEKMLSRSGVMALGSAGG